MSYGTDFYYDSQYPYLNILKWNNYKSLNNLGPLNNNFESDLYFIPIKFYSYNDLYYQINGQLNLNSSKYPSQRLFGTVILKFSKKLFFQNNFMFESKHSDNTNFKGINKESLDGWSGYLNSSILNYNYEKGQILIGKTNLFLNSFSESLLLNGEMPPNSVIWWHHFSTNWSYDWAIQFLEEMNSYGRFITLHRYSMFDDYFSFSFTELAIVRYKNFFRDALSYTLPSGVIVETEINDGGSNLFWFFDGFYKYGNILFLGEFLIDDYSLDGKSPHKIAYKIGSQFSFKYNKIHIEYIKINKWVGNYFYPELQMKDHSILLGHPIGPDAHKFSLKLYLPYSKNKILVSSFYIIEKGIGSINEPWPVESPSSNFGYSYDKFPSGSVDLIFGADINYNFIFNNFLIVESSLGYEYNTNLVGLNIRVNLIF